VGPRYDRSSSAPSGAAITRWSSAHELEALGYLHMALQQPLGTGFSTAIKVVA
jgi:hypothetical protein